MRTSVQERNVYVSGARDTNDFTIKANGKAFKVLIDGLYSNKIKSVIRELWSNAYDSHAEAGISGTPFDVVLPSLLDPVFSVRDYGVSLSHDGVMNLYTTIFESTKEDTNSQVGKFGLGSKSPFAYTDSFTVTAYLDGRCRVYSAFIGEDGVPQIALFSDTESSEKQGLQVSFPVKSGDFDSFKIEAKYVGLAFDIKPNILSHDDFVFEEITYTCSGEINGYKWGLSACEYEKAQARQGTVLYPIDHYSMKNISSEHYNLLNSGLVIEFPMGEIDIAPSREALSYDETTVENIKKALDSIGPELIKELTQLVSKAKTLWEASLELKEFKGRSNIASALKKYVSDNTLWRGKKIPSEFSVTYSNMKRCPEVHVCYIDSDKIKYNKELRWRDYTSNHNGIKIRKNLIFVVQDTKTRIKHISKRMHHYVKNNYPDYSLIWIKADVKSAGFKRFLVSRGRFPFLLLHELPDPPITANVTERKKVPCKKYIVGSYQCDDIELDPKQGGIYIGLDRGSIIKPSERGMMGASDLAYFTKSMLNLGLIDEDTVIYGIPRTHKNIPVRNPGWVSLWDLAKDHVENYFSEENYRKYIKYKRFFDNSASYRNVILRISKHYNRFSRNNPLYNIIRWCYYFKCFLDRLEVYEDLATLHSAYNKYQYYSPEEFDIPEFLFESVVEDFEKYPLIIAMMEEIASYRDKWASEYSESVVDYIIMIDKNMEE